MKTVMEVRRQILTCDQCELAGKCRSPIPMTLPKTATKIPSTLTNHITCANVTGMSQSREDGTGKEIKAASFIVLGEAPGRIEDFEGKPFIGPAGRLLRRSLGEVGLDGDNGAYMNVVSCWPHGKPENKHVEACRENLRDQLDAVDVRYVLCCGATALKSLVPHTTMKEAAGKLIPIHGKVVMPVLHPAYFLHKQGDRSVMDGWVGQLAKFGMVVLWGEKEIWEDKCVYCGKIGWPACKSHQGYWAADQKWDGKKRRNRKVGLQDERLW